MVTDWRSMYDRDYIGSWDLKEGKDTVVTITKVIGGNLVGEGGRKSRKPVIFMRGTEKGFCVNKTNGKAIASLYGNVVEQWVGKRIALYRSTTRNPNGEGEVDCIRVRPQIPATKTAQEEEAPA